MKKSIKKVVAVLIFLVAVISISFGQGSSKYRTASRNYGQESVKLIPGELIYGQDQTKIVRSRSLELKNESKNTEVKVNVSKEYNYLRINVGCNLRQGEVHIRIFDPSGELKRNLTIKTGSNLSKGDNTTIQESVNGEIEKAFRNPTDGDWTIRVEPTDATGNVGIQTILIYNPKADLLELDQIEKN